MTPMSCEQHLDDVTTVITEMYGLDDDPSI